VGWPSSEPFNEREFHGLMLDYCRDESPIYGRKRCTQDLVTATDLADTSFQSLAVERTSALKNEGPSL
jgi:hypothetical protein